MALYYIGTRSATAEAAQTFEEDYRELEPSVRAKVASSIRNRLHKHDMPVPTKVAAYAGRALSENLQDCLLERRHIVDDESAKEALNGLWEKRSEFAGTKLAEVLETFDRLHGLNKYWDTYQIGRAHV